MYDKYKLIVDEPWGHKEVGLDRKILGKVIDILDKNTIVFKSDKEFKVEGYSGKYFMLESRYFNLSLINEKRVGGFVNGYQLKIDCYDQASTIEIPQNNCLLLIGELKICKNE